MIDTATAWISAQLAFNTYMAFLLYWGPLIICVVGYTIRTWRNYQKDIIRREMTADAKSVAVYYNPTDTVGTLIGRAIVSVCPAANFWAAAFDVGPELFAGVIKRLAVIFDQPLVPPRKT
jgi:hypothetical protein